tara:strand:- start:154 stop:342 length:189 start_codon:yes stop_codon:yes gene_type:complete
MQQSPTNDVNVFLQEPAFVNQGTESAPKLFIEQHVVAFQDCTSVPCLSQVNVFLDRITDAML